MIVPTPVPVPVPTVMVLNPGSCRKAVLAPTRGPAGTQNWERLGGMVYAGRYIPDSGEELENENLGESDGTGPEL